MYRQAVLQRKLLDNASLMHHSPARWRVLWAYDSNVTDEGGAAGQASKGGQGKRVSAEEQDGKWTG